MDKKALGLIIAGVVTSIILAPVLYIQQKQAFFKDKILPNIYIENTAVGKLTTVEAEETMHKLYAEYPNFNLVLYYQNNPIATISAESLEYKIPVKNVVEQTTFVGRKINSLSTLYQFLTLNLGLQEYNFPLTPEYNKTLLEERLSNLNDDYKIDPHEAKFEFTNGRVTVFQMEEKGTGLDIETLNNEIVNILAHLDNKNNKVFTLKVRSVILYPKMKLKDINQYGIKELVAVGRSRFVGSMSERVHNIVTGANRINGTIVKSGETFSFVDTVGDISASTGYKSAYVIKGGKTVLDDGGGICQVSTTLFRSALNAGMKITERHAHAYKVGYYEQDSPPGFDATIYSPSVDFKFKNNYSNPILIQATVDTEAMTLEFAIYGQKDEREITISEVTTWNIAPPPPAEYVDDLSLNVGVVKQVDFPAWGASAKFSYKVSRNGEILDEQDFVSHFRPWKAIYLVGKK